MVVIAVIWLNGCMHGLDEWDWWDGWMDGCIGWMDGCVCGGIGCDWLDGCRDG